MIAYILLFLLSYDVFSETRQKIVVIDTGVSHRHSNKPYMCKSGLLSTYGTWEDENGHGSNIVGIIADRIDAKKTCIVSIRLEMPKNKNPEIFINKAISMAEVIKPVAINISMAGNARFESEYRTILRMIQKGTKVIVAAGNDNINLDGRCWVYPACYANDMRIDKPVINTSNFIVVGANDTKFSNTGTVVTVVTSGKDQGFPKMSGTSQATANFTAKLFSK